MKNIILMLMIVALVISCASVDLESVDAEGRPTWITKTPSDNSYIYGVGSGKLANEQNSFTRAESLSRQNIAKAISSEITSSIINYVNDAGSDTNRQTIDAFETISQELVNISLRGVEILSRYKAEDGTCYVITRYSKKNLKAAYEQQAKEYEDSVRIKLEEAKEYLVVASEE